MPIPTDVFRVSMSTTAAIAQSWFKDRSDIKTREQFESFGQNGENVSGAVYIYLTNNGVALYVGQTGRTVKSRLHDQMSPHKSKDWWSNWLYMRFVPIDCRVVRLVLEFLLIAIYKPSSNVKPKAKSINELFPL